MSLVFAFLKAATVFALVSISERTFPAAMLGMYLLIRRLASTLPSLTSLGVSNSLQRYIPLLSTNSTGASAHIVIAGAFVIVAALILALSGAVWPEAFGRLLVAGDDMSTDLASLAKWTAFLCALITIQFGVHGNLMGSRKVLLAQCGDLLAVGGWQLIGFAYYETAATPLLIVRFQTIAMALTTLPVLGYNVSQHAKRLARCPSEIRSAVLATASYGTTRGLSSFLDALLITLGPWFLRSTPIEMGYLLVALTILRISSIALTPVSKVAGISIAGLTGRRDYDAIDAGVNMLLGTALATTVIGVAVLLPLAPLLVEGWLRDSETVAGVQSLLVPVLLTIPFASIFSSLKTVVDVRSTTPHNLLHLVLALLTVAALSYIGSQSESAPYWAACGVLAGYVVLAAFTLRTLRQTLNPISYFAPIRLTFMATSIAWLSNVVAHRADPSDPYHLSVLLLGASLLFVGGVLGYVFIAPGPFARDVRAFLFEGRVSTA